MGYNCMHTTKKITISDWCQMKTISQGVQIENCTSFHLRKRNSMRGFVRPSVGPSVHWSVRPLVRLSVCIEKWENERFRTLMCMYLCWGGALGGALSVDGGWPPLPTRPQRYCEFVTPRHLFLFT